MSAGGPTLTPWLTLCAALPGRESESVPTLTGAAPRPSGHALCACSSSDLAAPTGPARYGDSDGSERRGPADVARAWALVFAAPTRAAAAGEGDVVGRSLLCIAHCGAAVGCAAEGCAAAAVVVVGTDGGGGAAAAAGGGVAPS